MHYNARVGSLLTRGQGCFTAGALSMHTYLFSVKKGAANSKLHKDVQVPLLATTVRVHLAPSVD